MSDWLNYDEYVPLAPDTAGGQVHVPHEGCTLKEKLYIKRTHDDTIIAWCHVCRKRGKHTPKGTRNLHKLKRLSVPTIVSDVKLPHDCIYDVDKWPTKARVWVLKYGIRQEEIDVYSLAYSPSLGRVILPCRSDEGSLLGWQGRDTEEAGEGSPKYLAQRREETSFYFKAKKKSSPCSSASDSSTLVITEDILSAIKSSRVCDSVAILGVWLTPKDALELSEQYDTVIVYLDNDNSKVRQQQENLKRLFKLFGCTVVVHRGSRDPKELSEAELQEIYDVR